MRHILITLTLLSALHAHAVVLGRDSACVAQYDSVYQGLVYTLVDEMPLYGKGEDDLLKYIHRNIQYPELKDDEDIQSHITPIFVIDTDGRITSLHIARKSDAAQTSTDRAAMKCLAAMSRWQPGRCRGVAVPVRLVVPINIHWSRE
jgi:hypothetical protein